MEDGGNTLHDGIVRIGGWARGEVPPGAGAGVRGGGGPAGGELLLAAKEMEGGRKVGECGVVNFQQFQAPISIACCLQRSETTKYSDPGLPITSQLSVQLRYEPILYSSLSNSKFQWDCLFALAYSI